jgi:hypothetical protein
MSTAPHPRDSPESEPPPARGDNGPDASGVRVRDLGPEAVPLPPVPGSVPGLSLPDWDLLPP